MKKLITITTFLLSLVFNIFALSDNNQKSNKTQSMGWINRGEYEETSYKLPKIRWMFYSNDEDTLFTFCTDHKLYLIDTHSGNILDTIDSHHSGVLSQHDFILLRGANTIGGSYTLTVYDLKQNKELARKVYKPEDYSDYFSCENRRSINMNNASLELEHNNVIVNLEFISYAYPKYNLSMRAYHQILNANDLTNKSDLNSSWLNNVQIDKFRDKYICFYRTGISWVDYNDNPSNIYLNPKKDFAFTKLKISKDSKYFLTTQLKRWSNYYNLDSIIIFDNINRKYLLSILCPEEYYRSPRDYCFSKDNKYLFVTASITYRPGDTVAVLVYDIEKRKYAKILRFIKEDIFEIAYSAKYDFLLVNTYDGNYDNMQNLKRISVDTLTKEIVSIKQVSKHDITLSPNPATDYIDINTSSFMLNEVKHPVIKIYDVLGICVLTTSPPAPLQIGEGSKVRFDVSGLAAGVYFVRVGEKVLKFVKI